MNPVISKLICLFISNVYSFIWHLSRCTGPWADLPGQVALPLERARRKPVQTRRFRDRAGLCRPPRQCAGRRRTQCPASAPRDGPAGHISRIIIAHFHNAVKFTAQFPGPPTHHSRGSTPLLSREAAPPSPFPVTACPAARQPAPVPPRGFARGIPPSPAHRRRLSAHRGTRGRMPPFEGPAVGASPSALGPPSGIGFCRRARRRPSQAAVRRVSLTSARAAGKHRVGGAGAGGAPPCGGGTGRSPCAYIFTCSA